MTLNLVACSLLLSSVAMATPTFTPDGALVHNTTEDVITGMSFPDERTMVVNAVLTIHYGGRMAGIATYDATYTIDLLNNDACLSGTGAFTGTLDGEPFDTTLDLMGDGLCGNLGTGVIGGIIKVAGLGRNFLQCGRSPLNPVEYLCTYRLFNPPFRFHR